MVEPPTLQWSPHGTSNIPIAAPRPTRRVSFTQLNLGSSSRIPSLGALAVQASPVPHTAPASTSGSQSASSSFRSLRSLLPFGPGKQQPASASNIPSAPRNSFSNFGSIRRSMTGERKNSVSAAVTEQTENSPVMAIDGSFDVGSGKGLNSDDESQSPSSDPFQSSPFHNANRDLPPLPYPEPGPTLSADLSTIIEADTSGISKPDHEEENSKEIAILLNDHSFHPDADRPLTMTSMPQPSKSRPKVYNNTHGESKPTDPCVLKLPASNISPEVVDALIVNDCAGAEEWRGDTNDVAAEGKSPLDFGVGLDSGEANVSFNLGALDPDLAALLSPNRLSTDDPTVRAINAISPPPLTPTTPDEDEFISGLRVTVDKASPVRADDASLSPTSPPLVGTQSTPAPAPRKSASLIRSPSLSTRPATASSSLPRLTRGYLTPSSSNKELSRSSATNAPPDGTTVDKGRRASIDQTFQRPPPSPLSSGGSQKPRFGQTSIRQPSQSRLTTPARQVTPFTPSSKSTKRPTLNRMLTAQPVSSNTESISPSARTSSSIGTTSSSHLQPPLPPPPPPARSSFDSESRVDLTERDRTFVLRSRKRSMSMEGGSSSQASPNSISSYQTPPISRPSTAMSNRPHAPATEWLGPRTAKAFAAAGLLDFEKEVRGGGGGRSASRFGTIRNGNDNNSNGNNSDRDRGDVMSRYTPSRTGFSEVHELSSSWGRNRSASRTMTVSEAGGVPLMESPTLTSTTHRTTFSGGSTAPTSVSASSLHNMQATLQLMKEKHDIETEALLSALSDSQRTTKILREENGELQEKILNLERQLQDAVHQISRQHSTFIYPHPRNPLDRLSRTVSADVAPKPSSHSRIPSSRYSARAPSPGQRLGLPDRQHHNTSPLKSQKRLSTTSSNFPILPSNMSLLMQEEDGIGSDHSFRSRSPPPSPTTALLPRAANGSLRRQHSQHNRSMSSDKNLSPSTTTFSMTGSPGSLFLRPEHELHLGDMTNLDLGIVPADDDRVDESR